MNKISLTLQRYSKFIAALVGAATEALNLGYIPKHDQGAVSIAIAILTALGVGGVSNGPAMQDGVAIANDVASLKDTVGPLKDVKGGLRGWVKWVEDLVSQHSGQALAEIEAAKTSVLDLLHQKSFDPKPVETTTTTTTQAPVTVAEPAPEPTVAEPEDPELAQLKATVGQ